MNPIYTVTSSFLGELERFSPIPPTLVAPAAHASLLAERLDWHTPAPTLPHVEPLDINH